MTSARLARLRIFNALSTFPPAYRIQARLTTLVPCGFEIPQGFEGQVRPRSGLAVKVGVTVLNTPGTIDSDYRGEIKVCLVNHGPSALEITRGSRIAQLVIVPVPKVIWQLSDTLPPSVRDDGGFGHTGVS